MYCKLFASLYQGTLRGRSNEILVFTNLLAHCDAKGFVDKHFRAIAEETGLTREQVEEAIKTLESPDPESRSADLEGARIIRVDEHRSWGWHVVNYEKYRAIRDSEDRRIQNRLYQERFRNKSKISKHSKPPSAQGEGEVKGEEEIPFESFNPTETAHHLHGVCGLKISDLSEDYQELLRMWEEARKDRPKLYLRRVTKVTDELQKALDKIEGTDSIEFYQSIIEQEPGLNEKTFVRFVWGNYQ